MSNGQAILRKLNRPMFWRRTYPGTVFDWLAENVGWIVAVATFVLLVKERIKGARSQAEAMLAWTEREIAYPSRGMVYQGAVTLVIFNTSPAPVYEFRLWLSWGGGQDGTPGEKEVSVLQRTIEPMSNPERVDPFPGTAEETTANIPDDTLVPVRMTFRDAQGRRWVRDFDNDLSRESWKERRRRRRRKRERGG